MFTRCCLTVLSLGLSLHSLSATAADRLAWTGAVTQVEGSAGGGLVPWALISGLETADQVGGSGFYSYVHTSDFALRTGGVSVGLYDRVEISVARQRFDAGSVIPGLELGQDVLGLKVRVAGDAVFDPDRWLPQIAFGVQGKRTMDFDQIPKALGARKAEDLEFYVAATKLYFAAIGGRNLVLNGTLRRTRANQFGLLGFGGNRRAGFRLMPEGSAAVLVTENVLLGAEWRMKPNNLGAFSEDSAKDVFLAWNPTKMMSATLAWADLGRIAGKSAQRGVYASIWFGF
jgi:hypothetical protein